MCPWLGTHGMHLIPFALLNENPYLVVWILLMSTTDTPIVSHSNRPIVLKGIRVNNLKNIDVEIPRNRLTVVTGVSGSGKSSLAFDTIYAEGQRRYVESLSSYARQFLERMDKPDVDFMQGISPAMAIQQKNSTTNPRSTVGTSTEIYDYLRLLYARAGRTISPVSGLEVKKDSPGSVVDDLLKIAAPDARFYVTFPISSHPGHSFEDEMKLLLEKGFFRLLGKNEELLDLNTDPLPSELEREMWSVLVDRLAVSDTDEFKTRLADSVESAFREGKGRCHIKFRGGETWPFSNRFERDGMEFTEPSPQMFSFNNPFGACPTCEGFGRIAGIDEDLVIPDPSLTIREGVIVPFSSPKFNTNQRDLIMIAARYSLPIDTPYKDLTRDIKNLIWNGKDEYKGVNGFFEEVRGEFYKVHMRIMYARYRGYSRCPDCDGYRIRKDALYIKVAGLHIGQVSEMTIGHAHEHFKTISLNDYEQQVAGRILIEIQKRLNYLNEVGLDYLTLDRLTNSLSGGEAQRINLANALGSSLIGSLYVLDEPTIGLHPRDNDRLIAILKSLRDIGNTVIIVEHDPEMMRAADNIIDIGPFAGNYGGEVVFAGNYESLLKADTLTGKYLSGRKKIEVPAKRRKGNDKSISIEGAYEHNLKGVNVSFPLQKMVVVTGVSGSGKSTLVHDTLYSGIVKELGGVVDKVGKCRRITGINNIESVEMVDQSPIGRSSRSNPATYTKAFDDIRDLFASARLSKMNGYTAGHFSFNVPGGRCEACQGEGVQHIEMQFLADIELPCETCGGKRYRKDVLQVKYRGKSIFDVLEMSIGDALDFFVDEKSIVNKLQVLDDVGLGYLKLGQSGTTLSGGEAQRVKLARFLAKSPSNHTLYFFDEPSTGLHFEDVARLLESFNRLVQQGHSVIIIEHNLDIIKSADWVIDIGPEGGFGGGNIVAEGTPEDIAKSTDSYTAKYLRDLL